MTKRRIAMAALAVISGAAIASGDIAMIAGIAGAVLGTALILRGYLDDEEEAS